MGFRSPIGDLNLIYDPGAPTSTGGLVEATQFCDVFGIQLRLTAPRDTYLHDWGQDCNNAKLIVCTWVLAVQDRDGQNCKLSFDLVNGFSPLVLGLDVCRYANAINLSKDPILYIQRPQDSQLHTFSTYIAPESPDKPHCPRTRLELLPRPSTAYPRHVTSLLSNLYRSVDRNPSSFATRGHRYTHVHPEQLKDICKTAGILTDDLEAAIDTVHAGCNLCVQHGRPLPSKKVSLTHVNEALKEEIQVDFTYVVVHRPHFAQDTGYYRERHILLVLTDTGTRYTEASVVQNRSLPAEIDAYERLWLCRHGASKSLSADDKYHRRALTAYIHTHGITFKARPTKRHNKLGIVERKNGTLKDIIRRLAMEHPKVPIDTLVNRSTFRCNLFSGSQLLSSFQLARGYHSLVLEGMADDQPSLLGVPPTYVSQELLEAHTHQVATRALQRVLRSRRPNTSTPGMFGSGDMVWVWYATSKQNEDDRWLKATVVKPHRHFLDVRRLKDVRACRGPTMEPAYEDVRVTPDTLSRSN